VVVGIAATDATGFGRHLADTFVHPGLGGHQRRLRPHGVVGQACSVEATVNRVMPSRDSRVMKSRAMTRIEPFGAIGGSLRLPSSLSPQFVLLRKLYG